MPNNDTEILREDEYTVDEAAKRFSREMWEKMQTQSRKHREKNPELYNPKALPKFSEPLHPWKVRSSILPESTQAYEGQWNTSPANTPEEVRRSAVKFDGDKPRLDLIPSEALMEVAKVFAYGAEKYATWNHRLGFQWTRLAAATLRHVYQWLTGEDHDQTSGLHHIAHAATNCLMLLDHSLLALGTDDRYTEQSLADRIAEELDQREKTDAD